MIGHAIHTFESLTEPEQEYITNNIFKKNKTRQIYIANNSHKSLVFIDITKKL